MIFFLNYVTYAISHPCIIAEPWQGGQVLVIFGNLNSSPTGNCFQTQSWVSWLLLKAAKNKLIKMAEIFRFLCSLGKIHIINKIKINMSSYHCYYILIMENDITKSITDHIKKKVILPQMLTSLRKRTPLWYMNSVTAVWHSSLCLFSIIF